MAVSLDLLLKNQGNMYELTCAVIKRAVQLNIADEEEEGEKVVQERKILIKALNQILTGKVEYQLEV